MRGRSVQRLASASEMDLVEDHPPLQSVCNSNSMSGLLQNRAPRRSAIIHICSVLVSLFLLVPSTAVAQEATPEAALVGEGDGNTLSQDVDPQQDPDDPPAKPHPDEQLRLDVNRYFNSSDSADWVRALTLLGARIDTGAPPQWSGPLLLDLLTERAEQFPQRTRIILQDRLMRRSVTGIPVLLVLLRLDRNWPFLAEVEENFRTWSSDDEIRARLLTDLSAEKDPLLISRLLPILAERDPRGTIDVAVGRLSSEQEVASDALMEALSGFLEQQLTRPQWIRWWGENRDKPILTGILERKEISSLTQQLRIWERANRLLREIPPLRFRAWLLESLADSEPFTLRRATLEESSRFAREMQAEGVELTMQEQDDLLAPLRIRCVELVSVLDDSSGSGSRSERQELAIGALGVLSQMIIFREDESLVRLLQRRISTLVPGLSNGDRRVARESLKMATALRAPVAISIDGAIDRFMPVLGSEADVPELKRLIAASRAVGSTIRTVELLKSLSLTVPELQEDILEAMVFGEVPAAGVPLVLDYYGDLLDSSSDANIRALAINGIGRLGVEEAIPLLIPLVLKGESGADMERRSALQMIRTIGGIGALDGMIEILGQMPGSDGLYQACLTEAQQVASSDASLGFLSKLLLDDEQQQRPWFHRLIAMDEVVGMLKAELQPTDLRTRIPGRFEQWIRLQRLRFQVQVETLEKGGVLEPGTRREQLLTEVQRTILLFGDQPMPVSIEGIGRQIRGVEAEIQGISAVELALDEDTDEVIQTFTEHLDQIARFSGDDSGDLRIFSIDPWNWLLGLLEGRPARPGDLDLVRAMRTLAEGRFTRDDVRERLDRLEARVDVPEKERSPAPPPSDSPEEADGRG